jgi:hypothetical protein
MAELKLNMWYAFGQASIMRKIWFTIILLLLCSTIGYGQDDRPLSANEASYKFTRQGNIYSFVGKFPVNKNINCLLDIISDFDHIKRIHNSADSVELIRKSSHSYDVRYSYQRLFLKAKTTFRRVPNKKRRIVTSVMIDHEQNSNLFPKLLASRGYYLIREDKTGCWFEYFREFEIESKSLDSLYIYIAKKEAIKHLYDIKEYIEKNCH